MAFQSIRFSSIHVLLVSVSFYSRLDAQAEKSAAKVDLLQGIDGCKWVKNTHHFASATLRKRFHHRLQEVVHLLPRAE